MQKGDTRLTCTPFYMYQALFLLEELILDSSLFLPTI